MNAKEVGLNIKNANNDREKEVTFLNIEGDDMGKRGASFNMECLNAKNDMNVSNVRNVGGMGKRNAKTELKGPLSSMQWGDDKTSNLSLNFQGGFKGKGGWEQWEFGGMGGRNPLMPTT